MEPLRLVEVEIEGYQVTSLSESIRLFKIMEATAKAFAEEVGTDFDLMLPVYRVDT